MNMINKKKDSQSNPVKSKATKQKTVAVKSRIKGAPVKRPKSAVKEKTKVKPAPIVSAGYSLYSATSDNSVNGDFDTCSELLARLKERRKESVQSDTNAPFNLRLSSSTPDPEKATFLAEQGNIFQTVPERDSSGPILTKETATNRQNFPLITHGQQGFSLPTSATSINIPFGSYGQYTAVGHQGNTAEVVNTSSSGFIPTSNTYTNVDIQNWARRDSDIQTYQAYIPRESTGFSVNAKNPKDNNDSKGNSSGSSGAKEISHLISRQQSINSSGTDYVVLPWPQGGTAGNAVPPGTPVFQLQNGLFQIRPANVQNQGQTTSAHEQLGIGQVKRKTPSPVQNDLGGSYLATDAFQIPERDNGPSVPQGVRKVSSVGLTQETLSSITGTNSPHHTITPLSQRTTSVTITPRTESSVNAESVHNTSSNKNSDGNQSKENPDEKKDVPNSSVGIKQNFDVNNKQDSNMVGNFFQGQSTSSSSDKVRNISDHKQNISNQGNRNLVGQNISGHSSQGQGQMFLLQTSQGGVMGNNSSFQLIPVSVLPNSNLHSVNNASVATTTCQPEVNANKQQEAVEIPGETTHANIANPWSKVKMDAGLKKLRYLLGELKECGKIGKDVEVSRLVKEVEKTIETIPTLSSKFNLMAEIDLCLQPLRNENCQLRRQLRLVNQKVKEKEVVKEKAALDFDVIHLQASNAALQKQVKDEKETKVKLALELKDLHSQIMRMKIERNKLLAALSEKETDELKVKQECLSDTQRFRHEIEELQRQTDGIQMKHESLEQENHILQITVQQRDTEICKMQEVVNEVKDCVASLIQELEESKVGDKSFVSNNSFSLQKLIKVLGEDSVASFTQSKHPSNRQQYNNTHQSLYLVTKEPPKPTPRLTKQALATHDKKQPHGGSRGKIFTYDTHHNEDFKTSNSDTEVELNVVNHGHGRTQSPGRRRHSLSPPSKRVPLRERNINSGKHKSPEPKKQTSAKQSPLKNENVGKNRRNLNRSLSPAYTRNPKVAFDFSKTSYRHDSDDFQEENYLASNVQQSCNQSEASRYSVTDYFRKYPQSQPNSSDTYRKRLHQRSYSQPNHYEHSNNKWTSAPVASLPREFTSPVRTSSRNNPSTFSPQDNLYHGTALDNSLSAITDDNISSVSERTSTSTATTVNDTSFRRGIAALDANILKLQLALQKTKSMLS
ncbi:putative leucine-rich repeat-containing protein DDB_G0290503 isoform X2 [Mytilus edulis]|uniref:putative leucine-rich repeat-containing protein DDB_G0290503 isoform X2 n=1 Tax=Mytilus edulis TaxID=6550 RepID=UPI0039EFD4E6